MTKRERRREIWALDQLVPVDVVSGSVAPRHRARKMLDLRESCGQCLPEGTRDL